LGGSTFYIIATGAVDVYIPVEKKVQLSIVELARLITDYRDMLVEVNGHLNFSIPTIAPDNKIAFENTSLESVLHKLHGSIIFDDSAKDIYHSSKSINSDQQALKLALRIGNK
jgi:hypothetical protein